MAAISSGSPRSASSTVKAVSRNERRGVDLHKPYIDDIDDAVRKMRGRDAPRARRWPTSGTIPARCRSRRGHWPFERSETGSQEPETSRGISSRDYISEAVDQTRGWFYTLLAVATLLGYRAPYKNVICLGHINDKHGQKMSKSKGNIVDPWVTMATYGVDAVRWYFYTATPPGEPKNFDEAELGKVAAQGRISSFTIHSCSGKRMRTRTRSKMQNSEIDRTCWTGGSLRG